MPCNKCGGTLDMENSSGGVSDGPFQEEYRCVNCRATGYISGDASDHPQNWNKYGSAFQ